MKLTAEDINDVINLYKTGKSTVQLGAQFGVASESIRYHLNKNNITLRSRSEALTKHTVNHKSFSTKSEERDYWAGFLFADGWIAQTSAKNTPSLGVTLKQSDRKHLEKLKVYLNASANIKDRARHDKRTNREYYSSTLYITSKLICADLRRLGMSGLDTIADSELTSSRHFWRGVIDGDGWIGVNKSRKQKPYPGLTLVGGKSLLVQYHKYISTIVPRYKGKVRAKDSIYCVVTSSEITKELLKHFYEDSNISLDRKYKLFRNITKGICDD